MVPPTPKIVRVKTRVSCTAINIRYLWIAHPSTLTCKNRNDWLPRLTTGTDRWWGSCQYKATRVLRNLRFQHLWGTQSQRVHDSAQRLRTNCELLIPDAKECPTHYVRLRESRWDWEPSFTSLFRPLRSGLWTGLTTSFVIVTLRPQRLYGLLQYY